MARNLPCPECETVMEPFTFNGGNKHSVKTWFCPKCYVEHDIPKKVLNLLKEKERTRPELVQLLNFKRTTIFKALTRLEQLKLVYTITKKMNDKVGRSNTVWRYAYEQ